MFPNVGLRKLMKQLIHICAHLIADRPNVYVQILKNAKLKLKSMQFKVYSLLDVDIKMRCLSF